MLPCIPVQSVHTCSILSANVFGIMLGLQHIMLAESYDPAEYTGRPSGAQALPPYAAKAGQANPTAACTHMLHRTRALDAHAMHMQMPVCWKI